MTVALLARERQDRRRITWLLIALVLLIVVTVRWGLPHIERSRTNATEAELGAREWDEIGVAFDGRDATLSGRAPVGVNPEEVRDHVDDIWGVRQVRGDIEAGGAAISAAAPDDDPHALEPATARISVSPAVDDPNREVITISGTVPSPINVDDAITAAGQAFGPSNVINELKVSTVEDAQWLTRIWTTLDVFAGAGRVDAVVAGDRLVISGTVGDQSKSDDIETILTAAVGGDLIIDNQLVVEALFEPLVSLDVTDGGLLLEGRLSEARIEEAETLAIEVFGPGNVSNELLAGSVRDAEWLAAVWDLLPALVGVGDVRLRVEGNEVLLDGGVTSPSHIDDLESEVAAALEGFGFSIVNTLRFDVEAAAESCPEDELNALVDVGVLFETESNALSEEGVEDLDAIVELLAQCEGVPVEVAGHTDSTGDADFNLGLSNRRAQAVVDYLIEQGIPAERLEAVGYGESKPVADNDTAEGRALNRRIEFVVGGSA